MSSGELPGAQFDDAPVYQTIHDRRVDNHVPMDQHLWTIPTKGKFYLIARRVTRHTGDPQRQREKALARGRAVTFQLECSPYHLKEADRLFVKCWREHRWNGYPLEALYGACLLKAGLPFPPIGEAIERITGKKPYPLVHAAHKRFPRLAPTFDRPTAIEGHLMRITGFRDWPDGLVAFARTVALSLDTCTPRVAAGTGIYVAVRKYRLFYSKGQLYHLTGVSGVSVRKYGDPILRRVF